MRKREFQFSCGTQKEILAYFDWLLLGRCRILWSTLACWFMNLDFWPVVYNASAIFPCSCSKISVSTESGIDFLVHDLFWK